MLSAEPSRSSVGAQMKCDVRMPALAGMGAVNMLSKPISGISSAKKAGTLLFPCCLQAAFVTPFIDTLSGAETPPLEPSLTSGSGSSCKGKQGFNAERLNFKQ